VTYLEPPKVIVYTSPRCMPCKMTKNQLTKLAVPYVAIDVSQDPDSVRTLRALGYRTTPVVQVDLPNGSDYWDGYRPDRIRALAYLVKGQGV